MSVYDWEDVGGDIAIMRYETPEVYDALSR